MRSLLILSVLFSALTTAATAQENIDPKAKLHEERHQLHENAKEKRKEFREEKREGRQQKREERKQRVQGKVDARAKSLDDYRAHPVQQ